MCPREDSNPHAFWAYAPEAYVYTNFTTRASGLYYIMHIRILRCMHYVIDVALQPNGFAVRVNKKTYPISYPSHIWKGFPKALREPFAQMMTCVMTMHLSFPKDNTIAYGFPTPANEAFFSYGLSLAMSENLLEHDPKKTKTTDYLRVVLNSYYRRTFTGHAKPWPAVAGYRPDKKTAIVPFSFGKDSLLTLGLCRELGIKTVPIFFLEPSNTFENKNKLKLIAEFKKQEGIAVEAFAVSLADLRFTDGFAWGWDNFLTQYTLLLLPYMYAYKASYFFWSNEYNRDVTAVDSEQFVAHHTFEQSPRWLQVLESALRPFGVPVKVASILERLPEFSVLGTLHTRYPSLASFQLSCLNDEPSSAAKRWCGNCYECAKVYIHLAALGIAGSNVELKDDMLAEKNKKHFYIFRPDDFHNAFTFNREEHLYAFYKAYTRGVRGGIMKEYVRKFEKTARTMESRWRARYFQVYKAVNTPEELQKPLERIFTKEVRGLSSSMR